MLTQLYTYPKPLILQHVKPPEAALRQLDKQTFFGISRPSGAIKMIFSDSRTLGRGDCDGVQSPWSANLLLLTYVQAP